MCKLVLYLLQDLAAVCSGIRCVCGFAAAESDFQLAANASAVRRTVWDKRVNSRYGRLSDCGHHCSTGEVFMSEVWQYKKWTYVGIMII